MPADVAIYLIFLSFISGTATFIGAFIGTKLNYGYKAIVFGASFSAMIMVLISVLELLPESVNKVGWGVAFMALLSGVLIIGFLDFRFPNVHSVKEVQDCQEKSLVKISYFLALGLILHDFPEGLAIPSSYLISPSTGLVVIAASFIHNIPEGYALSVASCAYRTKKFFYKASFFSGLATMLGTILGILFLGQFASLGPLFTAFAAGVMIYLSFDELLPLALKSRLTNQILAGLVLGITAYTGIHLIFAH